MKESQSGFWKSLRQMVMVTVILMLVCGLGFPLLLTGLSALLFPQQASGNLITVDGKTVGSVSVGQEFTEDYFLWSRPSAYHYNVYTETEDGQRYYLDGTTFGGLASGSQNYGPSNPALAERVEADIQNFLEKNPEVEREEIPTDLLTASGSGLDPHIREEIPTDLLTASGSGLDPHISPMAAQIQVPRIAQASGLTEDKVQEIIQNHTTGKLLGIFGEETVNVLQVNVEIAKCMGIL